jgi:hypothetical protein
VERVDQPTRRTVEHVNGRGHLIVGIRIGSQSMKDFQVIVHSEEEGEQYKHGKDYLESTRSLTYLVSNKEVLAVLVRINNPESMLFCKILSGMGP